MSRGLSRQQLQILGLATAVSRLRYGAPRAHKPQVIDGWRVPVVLAPYDVHGALAAHVLGGARWLPDTVRGSTHSTVKLEKTPAAVRARGAMSRVITTLEGRGLLAYGFAASPFGGKAACDRGDYGSALTTAGLAIGLIHELRIPDLERRLWLWRIPADKQVREEWNVLEPLDPPEFSLRAESAAPDVAYAGSMTPRRRGAFEINGSIPRWLGAGVG